jgi:hypothetical protein
VGISSAGNVNVGLNQRQTCLAARRLFKVENLFIRSCAAKTNISRPVVDNQFALENAIYRKPNARARIASTVRP